MNKEQFKIWMAGFYEGEGSVSNDISNNNKLRTSISQNDSTPLIKASKIWGGSVRKRTRTTLKGKICHGHEWRISHHDSLKFFNDIRPYMIIPYKIQQFEKVLNISKSPLDRRFKCDLCEEDFASPAGRRRHEKNIHKAPPRKWNGVTWVIPYGPLKSTPQSEHEMKR